MWHQRNIGPIINSLEKTWVKIKVFKLNLCFSLRISGSACEGGDRTEALLKCEINYMKRNKIIIMRMVCVTHLCSTASRETCVMFCKGNKYRTSHTLQTELGIREGGFPQVVQCLQKLSEIQDLWTELDSSLVLSFWRCVLQIDHVPHGTLGNRHWLLSAVEALKWEPGDVLLDNT